ncbi:hypothetical protein Htur_3116 [Haloterrigena turkmenica DSM 5511]|uniref:Uncharacterized protein n=1 Tax=Haloterrigena turkmenica (strain ATCC 51198 / DSM 5511 / JCM 9101 / NCIMB 13204 / VKM B-1734 / 4k) TaxID=543526 RepID=D2RZ13_HALTV|nr:hypothetical protein [Haloterrigena turkmenica]ADB61981.1 hypothetical protein Htur_3116 [Haloterrigena turkmenica DSM 5511]
MSTQRLQTRPETEPQPNHIDARTRPASSERADSRTAVERSPQTFSHRNTAQLQNLMDEFNTAFAATGDSASGS